jgi:hypothetical protein
MRHAIAESSSDVRYDWQPRITVGKLGVFHKAEVDIWSSFVKAKQLLCFARFVALLRGAGECSPTESALCGWGAPTGLGGWRAAGCAFGVITRDREGFGAHQDARRRACSEPCASSCTLSAGLVA